MKSIARMILVLGLVCTVAALALSVVYELTKEPIAEAYRQELLDAIGAVLPEFDNAPDADMAEVEGVGYYVGKAKGVPVGAAFKVNTNQGYSGLITALVGVDPEGKVTGGAHPPAHRDPRPRCEIHRSRIPRPVQGQGT